MGDGGISLCVLGVTQFISYIVRVTFQSHSAMATRPGRLERRLLSRPDPAVCGASGGRVAHGDMLE